MSDVEMIGLDDGRQVGRIRYGAPEEGGGWGAEEGHTCHDCGAEPGALHGPGCDVERCPRCGGQLFICGCLHPDEMTRFGWGSHADDVQTLAQPGAIILDATPKGFPVSRATVVAVQTLIRESGGSSRVLEMAGASSAHDGDPQAAPTAQQSRMRFEGTCEGLLDAITPVMEVAISARLDGGDYLRRISLQVTGQAIRVWATNGRMSIRKVIPPMRVDDAKNPCFVESQTIVTVEARLLVCYLHSFPPSELVCIELQPDGKELVISSKMHPGTVRHLPCYEEPIPTIPLPESMGQEVHVRREAFLRGISKVLFAAAKEPWKAPFLNVAFSVANGKLRFCAGTGFRFAWMEIGGRGLFKAKPKKQAYYLPAKHTSRLKTVLALSKDSHIVIGASTTGDMLLVRTTDTDVTIKLDPSIVWPDVTKKVIFRQPELQVVTVTKEWKLETKGIMATYGYRCRGKHLHAATVTADGTTKKLTMAVKCVLSSSRYVNILDYRGGANKVSFESIIDNLADVAKNADGDGYIQLHLNKLGLRKARIIVAWNNDNSMIQPRSKLIHVNKKGWTESFCLVFAEAGDLSKSAPSGQQTSCQDGKKEVQ